MLHCGQEAQEEVAYLADENTAFFALNKEFLELGLGGTKLVFVQEPSFNRDCAGVFVTNHLFCVLACRRRHDSKRFTISSQEPK